MDYGGNERCFVCLETERLKQGRSKVGKSIVKMEEITVPHM